MIVGQVNSLHEAVIPIKVYDANGELIEWEATIDTGFSGYLTLPTIIIEQLQLFYDRSETYTLGDNNNVEFDIYRATLSWNGQDRPIFVLLTESAPLIGMSSLRGCSLFIDVIDGGSVHITSR